MSEFSIEDLRLMAAVERQMDANEIPWVRVEGVGGRCAISEEVMSSLDLRTGQTISFTLWGEILKLHLKAAERALRTEVEANAERLEKEMQANP